MWTTNQPLLFDRDNLKQVFRDPENKRLLEEKYKNLDALYETLITQKAEWAEYVVGLPGAGKTKFAILHKHAQKITQENIHELLNMDFKKMVFVTADIDDDIAQKAKEITLIHTSKERIWMQRKERDKDIEEGDAETAFGRVAGTTAWVTTDATILISRLKTDYEHKSKIVMYNSNDPKNRDRRRDIKVSWLSEERKYKKEWIVVTSWSRAPFHLWHECQMEKVIAIADGKDLVPHAIVGWAFVSSKEYDVAYTPRDTVKIMNLVLKWKVSTSTFGPARFIQGLGKRVVESIPEESIVVLGKDRLPEGFKEWSFEDLQRDYPEFFLTTKNGKTPSSVVMGFHKKGYNYFVNTGNVTVEGSDKPISSTDIRKYLIAGDKEAVRACLSTKVFDVLTRESNMQAIRNRYYLVQERKSEMDVISEKYKHTDPISGQKLGMNKEGNPINLTKTYAKKHYKADKKAQAKISTYVERGEQKEKEIKKKYNKLIHYDNKFDLEVNIGEESISQ